MSNSDVDENVKQHQSASKEALASFLRRFHLRVKVQGYEDEHFYLYIERVCANKACRATTTHRVRDFYGTMIPVHESTISAVLQALLQGKALPQQKDSDYTCGSCKCGFVGAVPGHADL